MLPVVIRLLPDGSGRVRIHWFVRTQDGPLQTPTSNDPLKRGVGGVRGKIACNPQQQGFFLRLPDGRMQPTVHSDDPRAVTCPECMASLEFKEKMTELGLLEPLPQ